MLEFLVLLGIACIVGACIGLRVKWNKNRPIEETKKEEKQI